jgi:FdrA protein
MRLSNQLKSREGVKDAAIMLGTDSNIELMKNAGLLDGAVTATAADIIVSVVADDGKVNEETIKFAVEQLSSSAATSGGIGAVEMVLFYFLFSFFISYA